MSNDSAGKGHVPGFGSYQSYIVVLAPLLNSLSGIAIDLYAPSLPAIGREFDVSPAVMQNTITATLCGFAVGQLAFGVIADSFGRLRALLPGLLLFVAGSLLAMSAVSIESLMVGRALQGFGVGASQVVARALLVDNLRGERFYNAIIYLSLAWGLGPVLGPFVGSHIEALAGWRWNFVLYAVYGLLLLALTLPLKESLAAHARQQPAIALRNFASVASDARFQYAAVILGTSLAIFLLWNIIGPYIVQERLNGSVTDFGDTALLAGISYLTGTLVNRALVRIYQPGSLMRAGLIAFALGVFAIAAVPFSLTLPLLVAGVMLADFGQGLIFSNVLAMTMPLFPDRAGAAASLLGCANMAFGAVAASVMSTVTIQANWHVAAIFAVLLALQGVCIAGLLRQTRPRLPSSTRTT